MEDSALVILFKKLFITIDDLFDHQEFVNVNIQDLQDIFYKNLSEMLQLSFDIQVSVDELKRFTEEKGKDADEMSMAEFIVKTIETEKSYSLLNYYLCKYLQTYFDTVKQDKKNEATLLMVKNGIKEGELQSILDQYQQLVAKEKLAHVNA